jgi:predicted transcriptional regulator
LTGYESVISGLIKDNPNIISLAIIENKRKIGYKSKTWDITDEEELKELFSKWGKKEPKIVSIGEGNYRIFNNTLDRFAAKGRNHWLVGFKIQEKAIICKIICKEGEVFMELMKIFTALGRTLSSISSREPFIAPNIIFSPDIKFQKISPKFLFDTMGILRRLGLQKFGLTPEESKVYLALLEKGPHGNIVGNLNKQLDIKRTTIYRIIDRLIKNNWVEKGPKTPKGTQIYIARPINKLVNKIIEEKEEEIKILKSFQFLIEEYFTEGLEKSQYYEQIQSFGKEVFDIDVLGFMGLEKDFGIVIFEYEREIADQIRAKDKLALVYDKIREQIKNLKEKQKIKDIGDLDEYTKFEEEEIQNYSGANIFIRFKKGSPTAKQLGDDWILVIKEIAIVVDNFIYLIWASEEKFELIKDLVLKLKK